MTTHAKAIERYFEDEQAAAEAGWPRWVDAHSVTCVVCGGLADERETVSLWPEDYDDDPTQELIEVIANEVGFGEAHRGCFEYAREEVII